MSSDTLQPASSKKVKLIVNKLSKQTYFELLKNNQIDEDQIYQFIDTQVNGFGHRAINIATPILSSDAVNKKYVDDKLTTIDQSGINLYSLKTIEPVLIDDDPYDDIQKYHIYPFINSINKVIIPKQISPNSIYSIVMPESCIVNGERKIRDVVLHFTGDVKNIKLSFLSADASGQHISYKIDKNDDLQNILDTTETDELYLSLTEIDSNIVQISRKNLKNI